MNRYVRNLQLEGFDETSQARLRHSTVAVVGAGALGSVVAMYLAAAGVGRLRIADFDTIDLTNLQRQVFFSESEVGRSKALILAGKVRGLNSEVEVEVVRKTVTGRNAGALLTGCDVIAECSDNPPTKELTVSTGIQSGIPVVVGGVREYEGQVAVFAGGSAAYADVFPAPDTVGMLPCSLSGVFSPVPGIVGSMQASEVLKLLAAIPGTLENQLLTFDVRTLVFHKFSF